MVEKSSIDDAAVVADVLVAHTTELLVVASVGIAVVVVHNTFVDFAATAKGVRHTCGVDRA